MDAQVTDIYGLMPAGRVDRLRAVIGKHGGIDEHNLADLVKEARVSGSTYLMVAVQHNTDGDAWYTLGVSATGVYALAVGVEPDGWGTPDVYNLDTGERAVVSMRVDGWVAGELEAAA